MLVVQRVFRAKRTNLHEKYAYPKVRRFELGYWCRTRHQGRGFVTEAVRALTRFAF